jgi:polyferredoxin
MKRWVLLRRSSQAIFLLLFICLLLSAPRLVYGPLNSAVIFRLDPLITIIGSISERYIFPGLLLSLVMLFLTALLGRFFCGWMCPLGTTLDLIGVFGKKRQVQSDVFNRRIRRPKFFILAVIVLAAIAGVQIAWLFDPMVIMSRLIIFNAAVPIKAYHFSYAEWMLVFFAAAVIPAFFVKRFWCRALCPLGALYSLF